MLAQAQKAVAVNGIDRFVLSLGQVAQVKPEVLDKLDADQWADLYGDKLGVDPRLVVAGDKLALVRKERAAQQQAAQAGAALQQGADVLSKAGGVPLGPGTVAGELGRRLVG